ncbi:MAG: DUF1080 domain-containing protein [Acidobacteria bacterium]|nr:MAG: DUF1080 domain-containing protein [Acidobacteriota bacterium]
MTRARSDRARICASVGAAALALLIATAAAADEKAGPWTQLFNGRDLTGWETWLGIPDKSTAGIDLPRDADGRYAAPLGLNVDPKQVFTLVEVDGKPAIRISGEIFGALTGQQEYDDFHLRLEFKWGEKKWPPRENVVRDSGILYYAVGPHGASPNKAWMRSLECQVQEHDVGDYWGVAGAVVDVAGERRSVAEGKEPLIHFQKGAPTLTVEGPTPRAIKAFDNEKPTGSWNKVEVLCLRGTCVHAVNGKVNLVLTNPRQPAEGGVAPLRKGRLQIQTEGAEVFYRNIAVRPITEFPKEYRP